jgi:hypothetical protein
LEANELAAMAAASSPVSSQTTTCAMFGFSKYWGKDFSKKPFQRRIVGIATVNEFIN